MVPMKKLMLTCGMVLFSGALMAQTADQSQAAQTTTQAPATQMSGPRHAANPDREAKHLGKRLGELRSEDVCRLRQLETENARLKKLVAERDLEIEVMKEVAAKNC